MTIPAKNPEGEERHSEPEVVSGGADFVTQALKGIKQLNEVLGSELGLVGRSLNDEVDAVLTAQTEDGLDRGDPKSQDDIAVAMLRSAMEVTGEVPDPGEYPPVERLELDGYGRGLDPVIAEIARRHTQTPGGYDVAEVVAQEIDSLQEKVLELREGDVRKESLDDLQKDSMKWFLLPVERRHGDVVAAEGEVYKPCIDIEIDEQAKREVQDSLVCRRKGLRYFAQILDIVESRISRSDDTGEVLLRFDERQRINNPIILTPGESLESAYQKITSALSDKDAVVTDYYGKPALRRDIEHALFGGGGQLTLLDLADISPPTIEVEGRSTSGTLADLYISPQDIEERVKLGERVQGVMQRPGLEVNGIINRLGLSQVAVADRMVGVADSFIPKGTPLLHRTANLGNILASGEFSTRFRAGLSHDGEQGSWSNYIHYGDAGKMNTAYGGGPESAVIGLPIETIVAQAPLLQQEAMYGSGSYEHRRNLQQPYRRVSINVHTELPQAVRHRIDVLTDRFEGGIVAESSQGLRNNLAFAATDSVDTAANYGYSLGEATIIVSSQHQRRAIEGQLTALGFGEKWQEHHVTVADLDSARSDAWRAPTRSGLRLPKPTELSRQDRIVGFAPSRNSVVDFTEEHTTQAGSFVRRETARQRETRRHYDEQQAAIDEARRVAYERDIVRARATGVTLDEYRRAEFKRQQAEIDELEEKLGGF